MEYSDIEQLQKLIHQRGGVAPNSLIDHSRQTSMKSHNLNNGTMAGINDSRGLAKDTNGHDGFNNDGDDADGGLTFEDRKQDESNDER